MKSARWGPRRPGRFGERDDAGAPHAVQAVIGVGHRAAVRLGRQHPAAGRALGAAHLEHVVEVGVVFQADRQNDHVAAVVDEAQALVQPLVPQEPLALDMDRAVRGRGAAQGGQGLVGGVRGEEHVVLRHRRAQQGRRAVAQQQAQPRQQPGVVVEQAVGRAQHVAERVGDQEGVLVLQREQPVGDARFARLALLDGGARGRAWCEVVHVFWPLALRSLENPPRRAGAAGGFQIPKT
jgi:hypothetical protein